MFITLPVYGNSYQWTSDHSIHDFVVKTSAITAIEPVEWNHKSTFNMALEQNPKDRPKICLIY